MPRPTILRNWILPLLCLLLSAHAAIAQTGSAGSAREAANTKALKILFVGNSHLLVKNVPAQVRNRLSAKYKDVRIRMMAVGGARLSDFVGRANVVAALKKTDWDVVVLQEASVSFLSQSGRRAFHASVDWFVERLAKSTRVLLYQTWPWRTGSGFYGSRPFNENKMWTVMRSEYEKISHRKRISVAPVGRCWVQSPRKQTYYSADGNHASMAGAQFAARIIADTISGGAPTDC